MLAARLVGHAQVVQDHALPIDRTPPAEAGRGLLQAGFGALRITGHQPGQAAAELRPRSTLFVAQFMGQRDEGVGVFVQRHRVGGAQLDRNDAVQQVTAHRVGQLRQVQRRADGGTRFVQPPQAAQRAAAGLEDLGLLRYRQWGRRSRRPGRQVGWQAVQHRQRCAGLVAEDEVVGHRGQGIGLFAGAECTAGSGQRLQRVAMLQHAIELAAQPCSGDQALVRAQGLLRRGTVVQRLLPVTHGLGQCVQALRLLCSGQAVGYRTARITAGFVVRGHHGGRCGDRFGAQGQPAVDEPAACRAERGVQRLLHQVVAEGEAAAVVFAQQLRLQGGFDGQHRLQLGHRARRGQQRGPERLGRQGGGFQHARGLFAQACHARQHGFAHAGGHGQLAVVLRGVIEGRAPDTGRIGGECARVHQVAQRLRQKKRVAFGGRLQPGGKTRWRMRA